MYSWMNLFLEYIYVIIVLFWSEWRPRSRGMVCRCSYSNTISTQISILTSLLYVCIFVLPRFTMCTGYLSLSYNTFQLHVDPYISCFLSAAVEIPAYISSWLALRYLPRRLSVTGTLLLGAVSLYLIQLVPQSKQEENMLTLTGDWQFSDFKQAPPCIPDLTSLLNTQDFIHKDSWCKVMMCECLKFREIISFSKNLKV